MLDDETNPCVKNIKEIVKPHNNYSLRLTSFFQYYISIEDFTKDMEDFRSDQIFAPGAAVEEDAVAYVVVVPWTGYKTDHIVDIPVQVLETLRLPALVIGMHPVMVVVEAMVVLNVTSAAKTLAWNGRLLHDSKVCCYPFEVDLGMDWNIVGKAAGILANN